MEATELIVLILAALATGALVVNWAGLARAMAHLSVSTYVELHQNTNRTFDPYMPIVVVGAMLGGVALAILFGVRTLSGQLSAAGAACYAGVMVVGLPTCVQINKQVAKWSIENPPTHWAEARARWIHFHVIRTLFSIPGLALYLSALIFSR